MAEKASSNGQIWLVIWARVALIRYEVLDFCIVIRSRDGCPYALRSFCRFRNAGVLRARKPQSLVRAVVRRFVRSRVRLWSSSRGLAVRSGRGDLVSRCPSALAHGSEVLIFAQRQPMDNERTLRAKRIG